MYYSVIKNSLRNQNKVCRNLLLPFLIINCIFFISCGQNDNAKHKVETISKEELPKESKYDTPHPYGGWSCPDNFGGFPPVNIRDLDKILVVDGRLPTKEETKNGTSLLYFDPIKNPYARPLDMNLPRVARYYSKYTKKNELVIVIQAVVADKDSVVGFRYLNGGNGSAWLGEITFVGDKEIEELGSTPFVFNELEISSTNKKIWEVITSPKYAKELGAMFDKNAFIESDWKMDSEVHFKYEPDRLVSTGIITASWENMYIQIDYDFDGYHYVEKILILENKERNSMQLYVVAGPYGEDYEDQIRVWNNWLQKVKEMSEAL